MNIVLPLDATSNPEGCMALPLLERSLQREDLSRKNFEINLKLYLPMFRYFSSSKLLMLKNAGSLQAEFEALKIDDESAGSSSQPHNEPPPEEPSSLKACTTHSLLLTRPENHASPPARSVRSKRTFASKKRIER